MPSIAQLVGPGHGAYLARREQIQDEGAQEMRQAQGVMTLQGLMQQQRQKQLEMQREQEYRDAITALGDNPSQEQLVRVAAQRGSPDVAMRVHQGSLDRQAATEAARTAKEAALEQRRREVDAREAAQTRHTEMVHEFRMANAKTDAERLAETTRHNRAREAQAAELAGIRSMIAGQGGKAPPGYRHKPDGTMEAIPGGPADTKLQGVMNQDTATLTTTEASLDRLATAANEVMRHPGLGGTTGLRGAIPNIPGSDAANAAAKMQTLKAQVGFGVLQEMRNASKTGGALGAITEKELGFLQNALAALDKSQDEDQMKESLQKIIEYAGGAKGRLRGAFNLKHGARQEGNPASPSPAPAPGAPVASPASQAAPAGSGGAWTPEKERRYQELLNKRNPGGT